jgi:glutathione S-transferase
MAKATLTISSKNYSSWSLRGWLLTKFSGLEFDEISIAPDDPSARAEILLLSSSILVPCLRHDGATGWDTLAIGEYLNDLMPDAGLLPSERIARAHCRSICGEIHSGFATTLLAAGQHRGTFPASRSGLVRRGTSIGFARSGAIAWKIRRSVSVWASFDGGRDVCTGGDALCDL